MILLDGSSGSVDLALYEPLRSLLPPCLACGPDARRRPGKPEGPSSCLSCYDTGRQLVQLGAGMGDFWFLGWHVDGTPQRIGGEVKRVSSDLLSSIQDGSLTGAVTGRLIRMREQYDRVYLVHVGHYRPSPEGLLQLGRRSRHYHRDRETVYYSDNDRGAARHYSYLEAALSGPSFAALGVERVRVATIEEAAAWIAILYAQWTKDPGEHKGLKRIETYTPLQPPGMDDKTFTRLCWAHQFSNFGFARAEAMANHFPSVRAMVNADAEEIAEVLVDVGAGKRQRIGKPRAKAAVEEVS